MGRLERIRGRRPRIQRGPPDDLRQLSQRLDALERMVEALQDSADRQATRHDERLAELARQLQPRELARALSEDARRRGL